MGKLVITRKPGESFVIGDSITVTIESIDKKKARVSIQAPRELTILRTELVEPHLMPKHEEGEKS